MWVKIFCVIVIASGAFAKKDELLDTLYGLEGKNKVAVCVATPSGRWRSCDGALITREWVVARAQCIATAPVGNLSTERPSAGGSCDRLMAGKTDSVYSSRPARHLVMHPYFDLSLVIVKYPYNNMDTLGNATTIRHKLQKHGVHRWMQYYFDAFALTRSHGYNIKTIAQNLKTLHYPFWYFFVTMLLPSALLMGSFIYITYYTGDSKKPQDVPYKKMHYSKKVSHV